MKTIENIYISYPYLPPSLPPSKPPSFPLSLPPSGLQRGFASDRRSLVATCGIPPSLPLASREASPLTGLWQPSGIDKQRSLGTTCGIRIDNYMYRYHRPRDCLFI